MLDKSVNYSFYIIVPWAVSTKNVLLSCYGYSPNQFVFRKNIFPFTLTNLPPTIEMPSSELSLQHLTALHEGRKAFIETEANKNLHTVYIIKEKNLINGKVQKLSLGKKTNRF